MRIRVLCPSGYTYVCVYTSENALACLHVILHTHHAVLWAGVFIVFRPRTCG